MKRILGLTVAALMVMGLVGGGTWAFFSDPETTTGNTLSAGTLSLSVESEESWSTPVTFADLQPGAAAQQTVIDLENTGSLSGDLYMKISSVVPSTGTGVYPTSGGDANAASSEPEYVAEGGPGDWVAINDIDTQLTLAVDTTESGVITGLDSVLLSAVPVGWTAVETSWITAGTLTLNFGATFSTAADNEYQGDDVTFTIEFMLVQVGETP